MALTIIVEDGSTVDGANSFVSLAEAETFFEGRSHTETWDAAAFTDDLKTEALVNAAQILEQQFVWRGRRTTPDSQPMQWPRYGVREPDRRVPGNEIPKAIKNAQCLIAQNLLANTNFYTRDPGSGGADQLKGISLGQGALKIDYQTQSEEGAASERYKTVVDGETIAILSPYGSFKQGGAMRKVRRG